MAQKVRLLIGTRKGGFIFTSGAGRSRWKITGPLFAGWEVFHIQGSSSDPDRLYASLWTPWTGPVIQRSTDGGLTWHTVGNQFLYKPPTTFHKDFSREAKPWTFRRVWHLKSSLDDTGERVLAGIEDAALFQSLDGGASWEEVHSLRLHPTNRLWEPGGGGLCLHTILTDPTNPHRLYVAISAAGAFRSDDAGRTWRPINRGLRTTYTPEPEPEAGYCVHKMALHPARPHVLFMQKHGGVYRSDDAGETWEDISAGLPSNFGFPIAVHSHDPNTVYVVPLTDDERRYPPEGALRVWRSRDGGGTWEPVGKGLPDRHCYVNVLRDAMAVDQMDPCGIYFGTTGGQIYASRDAGGTWRSLVANLPPVYSVEAQTPL